MKEPRVLYTLLCICTVSILWVGRTISVRTKATKQEKVNPLSIQRCRPCHYQDRYAMESMIFMQNNTNELLDPVNGPLAFANEQVSDPLCPVCRQPDIIITFVNEPYLDPLSVWLQYYKHIDHSHRILCLFALSPNAYEKMEHLITSSQEKFLEDFRHVVVVQAALPTKSSGHAGLWAYRVRTLNEFLHSFPTLNIIFTDVDALWLKDPQPLFSPHLSDRLSRDNSTIPIDIVASQATFPPKCPLLSQSKELHQLEDIGEDGGRAVFGFIYFRNGPATRQLAAMFVEEANQKSHFDDQRALNCYLYRRYSVSSSAKLSDGSFLLQYTPPPETTNGTIIVTGNNFSTPLGLRLLSGSQVVRHCGRYANILHKKASVVHCLSNKNGDSKIKEFQSNKLLPIEMSMYDWEMKNTSQDAAWMMIDAWQNKYSNKSATAAFALAVQRFKSRSTYIRHKTAVNLFELSRAYGRHLSGNTHILNSVRVPKAGSSSLSIIARALAGCLPDGFPACNFPGDPPGSCPRKGLMCPMVKGHVGHRPNYDHNDQLPIITSLRDPKKRLLSAFFYTKPHRPEPVGDHRWETFLRYITMPKYRNVITKMLSGSYSYEKFDQVTHTVEKSKQRLCQIHWFYIIGMEMSGRLLLYETSPFDKLIPNPVIFDLPPFVSSQNGESKAEVDQRWLLDAKNESLLGYVIAKDTTGKRHNKNSDYDTFIKDTFVENNGTSLIHQFNKEDVEVYEFAVNLTCAKLGRSGILDAVAGLEDDIYGSYQLLKEIIQHEVELFCLNDTITHPVELYCPNHHSKI